MRGWRATIAGAALLGVLLVDPAGAQAAPTLTASPDAANPGDVITVTVEGCEEPPGLGYQVVNGSGRTFEVDTVDAGGGTFSTQVVAPFGDLYVYLRFGECGLGTTLAESPILWLDVEAPLLFAVPSPELPLTIYGTDCPSGATPELTFTFGAQSYDVGDLAVDDRGDWSLYTLDEVPDAAVAPPGPSRVDATCGDLVYETLDILGADEPGPTTTTITTPPTTPADGSSPAARPVAGTATFTG